MDLETFASLFTGSPFKPLLRHRNAVLDGLLHLNRQIQSLSSEQMQAPASTPWIKELPHQLELLEQEVLSRLQRPSLTAQPKEVVIDVLQTQSQLAHQIFRLSERLSYRPLRLPAEMIVPLNNLTRQFGKTVYQLRQGVIELDELSQGGFRKQHSKSQTCVRQSLASSVDELRKISHEIREQTCQMESEIDPVDVALLFLILDDISDLSLWMRSLITHLQA
ncbi:MAG: DUF47 family protein [Endozoicomonas sp.]|uniref:DUF47 family protein n=1 Tax=Endozoicomonas sp. TaxID=1892382 RepID=UPI003D9BBEAF